MDVNEEALVDAREDPGRPVTAGDVVDELGIARRTAHNKLGALVERGVLETRKIGARGRVWWRPIPADSVDTQPPRDARQTPERPVERVRERGERSALLVARTPSPRNSPPVVVSGTVSLLRGDGKGRLMGDETPRTNDDPEDDPVVVRLV